MSDIQMPVPQEPLEERIVLIRGLKVMLSTDLASLYGVVPKVLMQAVRRNIDRFPSDFMFQLSNQEVRILKSQSVTSSWGGIRKNPHAFTEQGVAMLSSVLHSERAIRVNIEIMRAFVRLRRILAAHKDLARKFEELERRVQGHDESIQSLVQAIRQLMTPPPTKGRKIGFVRPKIEPQ